MMMTRCASVFACLVVPLLLASCGGDSDAADNPGGQDAGAAKDAADGSDADSTTDAGEGGGATDAGDAQPDQAQDATSPEELDTVEYWRQYYLLRSTGQDPSQVGLKPLGPFDHVYYVAPDGDDESDGSEQSPFRTIEKAVSMVTYNDCIYLRGGVYEYDEQLKIRNRNREVSKPADPSDPFEDRAYANTAYNYLLAYPGEEPVLDFSSFTPSSIYSGNGVEITDDYWHLRGITITHAPRTGLVIHGSHNIVENCVFTQNGFSGLLMIIEVVYGDPADPWNGLYFGGFHSYEPQAEGYYYRPAGNKIINCDSFDHIDFGEDPGDKDGNDGDGFEVKSRADGDTLPGPGNEFIGCRAWHNSDDGFDFFMTEHTISVLSSWAFSNGIDIWQSNPEDNNFQGDGNGFKFGNNVNRLEQTHSHVIRHSIAFGNAMNGFDENQSEAGITLVNNTGWANEQVKDQGDYSGDFYFNIYLAQHTFVNNLVLDPSDVHICGDNSFNATCEISSADPSNPDNPILVTNSWDLGHDVTAADFVGFLDVDDAFTAATAARGAAGELPNADFITLESDSPLIDQGSVYDGWPESYAGSAPCVGALCEPH